MRTQSIHDKSEQSVSRTVRRSKAIVDENPQRHSTEVLPARYIGRDENTKYP